MKLLLSANYTRVAAGMLTAVFMLVSQLAVASTLPAQNDPYAAAGLPNLDQINHPPSSHPVTTSNQINVPRLPSFHQKSGDGTEITEYRDYGKPVEIDVRSGLGTRYQMSKPTDNSPRIRNNGPTPTRLPSLSIHY